MYVSDSDSRSATWVPTSVPTAPSEDQERREHAEQDRQRRGRPRRQPRRGEPVDARLDREREEDRHQQQHEQRDSRWNTWRMTNVSRKPNQKTTIAGITQRGRVRSVARRSKGDPSCRAAAPRPVPARTPTVLPGPVPARTVSALGCAVRRPADRSRGVGVWTAFLRARPDGTHGAVARWANGARRPLVARRTGTGRGGRPGCAVAPRRTVRHRRAGLVRRRCADPPGARRRLDVHRRAASAAVPVAAPAGDGRRGTALRLSTRPVGPAPAHRRLPCGHDLRASDPSAASGRSSCTVSTPASSASRPTASHMQRTIRTCSGGSTSPNSTASSRPTTASATSRSSARDRDALRRRGRPWWPRRSASSNRRRPKPSCAAARASSAPNCAGHARHARRRVTSSLQPPLPLAARAPYGLIAGAAIALMPAWTRWPLRLPWLPVSETVALRPAGELVTQHAALGHRRPLTVAAGHGRRRPRLCAIGCGAPQMRTT